MNHRLDELYEQSLLSIPYRICPNTYKEIDDPAGTLIRKEFDPETFAELIVKECADISDASFHNGSAGYLAILKHFGLEDAPVDDVDRILRTVRTRS